MNKLMDYCFGGSAGGFILFVFGGTFLIVIFSAILVSSVYTLSGAKDRDIAERKLCQEKGGKMIYVKGTGDVCIKGVIELEEVK